MRASEGCKQLIKVFEGLNTKAYKCPAGVWTIGYGSTAGVQEGQVITKDQAEILLDQDLGEVAQQVEHALDGTRVNQNQFDALCSFTFNLGAGNLEKSTLLKRVKAGDLKAAANEFLKWNRAGGQILDGLTRRRQAERRLFLAD